MASHEPYTDRHHRCHLCLVSRLLTVICQLAHGDMLLQALEVHMCSDKVCSLAFHGMLQQVLAVFRTQKLQRLVLQLDAETHKLLLTAHADNGKGWKRLLHASHRQVHSLCDWAALLKPGPCQPCNPVVS